MARFLAPSVLGSLVPIAGLPLHPLSKLCLVHGSCRILCAEQGNSGQGGLSKDSLRGRHVSNIPMARFCSPGRVTRHHFTRQHLLAVHGCLGHSSGKEPVLRDEVSRSISDVCIGNRGRGDECQGMGIWVCFPVVILKPLVKSHLKELPLTVTGNERRIVSLPPGSDAKWELPPPIPSLQVSIMVVGEITWRSSQKGDSHGAVKCGLWGPWKVTLHRT